MKLWYYSWQFGNRIYMDSYDTKSDAVSDRKSTLDEGRWAGPLRSVEIVKDRPATAKKGAKRAR